MSYCFRLHGLYIPPGSSALGIFQRRILEWVAISFSRGSSPPSDRTDISCLTGSLSLSHLGRPHPCLEHFRETLFTPLFLCECWLKSSVYVLVYSIFGICWHQLRSMPTFKFRDGVMTLFALSVFQKMLEVDVNRRETCYSLSLFFPM